MREKKFHKLLRGVWKYFSRWTMDICFPAKGSSKGSNMLSINERKTTNEQMRNNCIVRSERHRFALLLSAVGVLGLGWEAAANIYAHTHRSHGSWPSFSKNRIITGTRSKTLLIRLGMIEGRSQNASSHSFWTTRVFKGTFKAWCKDILAEECNKKKLSA